jgi:hypothetical protein
MSTTPLNTDEQRKEGVLDEATVAMDVIENTPSSPHSDQLILSRNNECCLIFMDSLSMHDTNVIGRVVKKCVD